MGSSLVSSWRMAARCLTTTSRRSRPCTWCCASAGATRSKLRDESGFSLTLAAHHFFRVQSFQLVTSYLGTLKHPQFAQREASFFLTAAATEAAEALLPTSRHRLGTDTPAAFTSSAE